MAARPECPKCHEPAYRAYSQVQNPETHRSTSVAIPAVFCGSAGFANGHGVLSVEKGQHGLVPLPAGTFATQMRQSRAAVARIPKGSRKGGKPVAKPKAKAAKKAPSKKAKAKAASKPTEGA
jgi:hypothetical protein